MALLPDWFYQTSPAVPNGYTAYGIACYVFDYQFGGTVPLFRWFHPVSGHYYTTDPTDHLPDGWRKELVSCFVFRNDDHQPGTSEFWSWLSPERTHYFTIDPDLTPPGPGWIREGLGQCCAFATQAPDTVPFYRFHYAPPHAPSHPAPGEGPHGCPNGFTWDRDANACVPYFPEGPPEGE